MNWVAIGAVGEVVGGLAVFISLVYLAMQIRSSRRSDQILAAAEAASAVDDWIGQIVRDENLWQLYRRGLTDYESLSREEKGRFSMLILQFLRSMEVIWYQRQLGAIEPGYWSSMEITIKGVISSSGASRSFKRYRSFLSPEFGNMVDEILTQSDTTQT